jgi:hypothetical protein
MNYKEMADRRAKLSRLSAMVNRGLLDRFRKECKLKGRAEDEAVEDAISLWLAREVDRDTREEGR